VKPEAGQDRGGAVLGGAVDESAGVMVVAMMMISIRDV